MMGKKIVYCVDDNRETLIDIHSRYIIRAGFIEVHN